MLRTDRLILRPWVEADAEPWAELNADPVVMEHFPASLTRPESDAFLERLAGELDERGWGWFAVEVVGGPRLIGGAALAPVFDEAPFAPATEVGWRLAREHWGHGYATEAARELLRFGFEALGLDEVVSFTATSNRRSEAVMVRLGMEPHPTWPVFEHPRMPVGHRLRPHLLYRLRAGTWRQHQVSGQADADGAGRGS